MPTASYASPFPRLDLTLDEKEQLVRTADELFDTIRERYERFMWKEDHRLPPEQWSVVREHEDVRVYHDRRPGAGTDQKNMHLLLTHGTILATLNDAMYGVFNHSTNDMRIKTAYVKNTILDSAVLENILEPTPDQPFQSLTVRWFVKGVPLHLRALSQHRDNVFLEATGIKRLSNGEPVGFHIMHSLKFDKAPPLPQYHRFNFSICTLWRTKTPKRAEAFMTSYVEIPESITTPMLVKSHADPLIVLWKYAHSANMKKLAWLVRQKETISLLNDTGRSAVNEGCSVCGSHGRSTRKGLKSECAACSKYTCKRCRVKRELSIFAPDGQLIKHEMRFCIPCVTVANKLDSGVVASHEVSDRIGQQRTGVKGLLGAAMGRSPSMLLYSSDSSHSSSRTDGETWTSSASVSSRSSFDPRSIQVNQTSSTRAQVGIII